MLSNINVGVPVLETMLQGHNPIIESKQDSDSDNSKSKNKSLSEALKYKYQTLLDEEE